MGVLVPPGGPSNAQIFIVGEAPGAEEVERMEPFVGLSGQELNRMLHESGIMRSECFTTNVSRERPLNNDINHFIAKAKKDVTKDHSLFRDKMVRAPILAGVHLLNEEIQSVKPNIIIALGNTPLWALTGRSGILKHRGSMLYAQPPFPKVKVIPTLHPAYILRDWSGRVLAINDLKRAARFRNGQDYPIPQWSFTIRPTFDQVTSRLLNLITSIQSAPRWIDFDLETKNGHIDCAGISWSLTEALCIPFMSRSDREGYWSGEEEGQIIYLLYRLLTHPNCWVRGQNLLYDCQYTYRHWHFSPNVRADTMIQQHVIYCGMKKSLDFQASMYCDYYVQWKPDKSAWAEGK